MPPLTLQASKVESLAEPEDRVQVVRPADLKHRSHQAWLRHSDGYSRLISRESKEGLMGNVNGLRHKRPRRCPGMDGGLRVLMELPSSLPLRSINTFFATLRSAAKGALYYSIIVPG